MNWIDKDGIALRYDLSGERGRTLVLVHEMGGSLESWDDVLAHLPGGLRVLRYDLRGSGLSEKIAAPPSVEWLAADILALLDANDLREPVALAGCAAGSAVALCFAALYPHRTVGVIALSPAIGVQAEHRADRLKGVERVEREGQRAIEAGMLAAAYPQEMRDRDPARFEAYRARWISADPRGFAAQSRMLFDLTFKDYLPDVSCPVIAVAGTHDPLRPPDHVEELSRHIPGARYIAVDSGHFMNAQSPDLVARVIETFLREHSLL